METELPSLASTDQGQYAFGPATDPATPSATLPIIPRPDVVSSVRSNDSRPPVQLDIPGHRADPVRHHSILGPGNESRERRSLGTGSIN